LARSSHAAHLKKLDLSGNDLSGSQLSPFQCLLQAAAATLLHLELTECQLADAQLLATLPTLTLCQAPLPQSPCQPTIYGRPQGAASGLSGSE
jgi:hypothetical protein